MCARERVHGVCLCAWPCDSVVCVQTDPGASRLAQHSGSAGLQVAGPRITEAVASPASPVSRTLGLAAALWPSAGEGVRREGVPARKGAFGLRREGRGHQRPSGRAGMRMRGQHIRARVFALLRPPGWTCS